MKQYLVTLNVVPELEEMIVDALLVWEEEQGFSSFPVNSHHHENKGLSIAEQVTGRQKKIRFQLYVAEHDLPDFLNKLQQDFSGTGIQYWILPVIQSGML